jgi:hypothetical protein
MKTIVMLLMFSALSFTAGAHTRERGHGGPVRSELKAALDRTLDRQLFYPADESGVEGRAELLLGVDRTGAVELLTIETDNPRIQAFLERRLAGVFVRKELAVPGQTFRYELVFRRQ